VNGKLVFVDHIKDWKKCTRVTKAEWQAEFDNHLRKARRLARKRREWIERVAKLLMEKRTLTDEDIPPL
jgi:ATP-dependent Zn protease